MHGRVCGDHSDAVFADSEGFHPAAKKDVLKGGAEPGVLLEFDYYRFPEPRLTGVAKIPESYLEIDGDPLSKCLVHKGYARKSGFNRRRKEGCGEGIQRGYPLQGFSFNPPSSEGSSVMACEVEVIIFPLHPESVKTTAPRAMSPETVCQEAFILKICPNPVREGNDKSFITA